MWRPLAVAGIFAAVVVGVLVLAALIGGPRDPHDPVNPSSAPVTASLIKPAAAAEPPPLSGGSLPITPGLAPALAQMSDLLVVPHCHLTVIRKQEVPTQRDGQLLYVATELSEKDRALLPADADDETKVSDAELDRLHFVRLKERWVYAEVKPGEPAEGAIDLKLSDGNVRKYRRVREDESLDGMKLQVVEVQRILRRLQVGDEVKEGQLLALVDPRLAADEFLGKQTKVAAARADHKASEKTRDEAQQRYNVLQQLHGKSPGSVPLEDIRGAKLTWDRYVLEAVSKEEAIKLAERELNQALTVLQLHEVRAKVPGVIHAINRQQGDAVKNQDTILQLQNHDRLRVEGRMVIQDLAKLPPDLAKARVVIEPTTPVSPQKIFPGHRGPVRGVAVSQKRQIVSASEDATVRVWDRKDGELAVLSHPKPVLSVACTPKHYTDAEGNPRNLCLTGCADGYARLWDLDRPDQSPLVFKEKHAGPINCVAFSPQTGTWCATAGEDRAVCLWDTRTGELLQRFAQLHAGGVTSVQFLSRQDLVTAGREGALAQVSLGPTGTLLGIRKEEKRGGEVPFLGVHPGGKPGTQLALFDSGRELRILQMPSGKLEAAVQNTADALNFSAFAIFSPDEDVDGKPTMILTGSAGEGRVRLWRMPDRNSRAYELRQLTWPGQQTTCGAFSPMDSDNADDRFIVTGTRDYQVLVWDLPTREEVQEELTAKLTLLGPSVDMASRELQIWSEMENKKLNGKKVGNRDRRLWPGQTATMVVYPK